jgi:hypothetical protein
LGQDGQALDLVGGKGEWSGGENVLAVDEGTPDEGEGLHQVAGQHDSLH